MNTNETKIYHDDTQRLHETQMLNERFDRCTFDAIERAIESSRHEYDATRALMYASIRLFDVERKFYKCESCIVHYKNQCANCRDDDDDDDYVCEYCDAIDERATSLFERAMQRLHSFRRDIAIRELQKSF